VATFGEDLAEIAVEEVEGMEGHGQSMQSGVIDMRYCKLKGLKSCSGTVELESHSYRKLNYLSGRGAIASDVFMNF
jgi:hypothetical protein